MKAAADGESVSRAVMVFIRGERPSSANSKPSRRKPDSRSKSEVLILECAEWRRGAIFIFNLSRFVSAASLSFLQQVAIFPSGAIHQ
jgi:hypothetical protein